MIHFAGDERPWKAGNLCHYRQIYNHYLALTPWKGTPEEEGQRLYLLAYHAMDYLTWLCPPARRLISRKFGMQVVENRNGPEPVYSGAGGKWTGIRKSAVWS